MDVIFAIVFFFIRIILFFVFFLFILRAILGLFGYGLTFGFTYNDEKDMIEDGISEHMILNDKIVELMFILNQLKKDVYMDSVKRAELNERKRKLMEEIPQRIWDIKRKHFL